MSTMSEKKRKRLEQREERPAKKVAIAPPGSSKVRFKYIEEKEGLAPVLAATPGLSFPSIPLKAYRTNRTVPPPGVEAPPYHVLLQSSQHPKLDYLAQEEKDGSADCLLKDYVGVYDPATGELQLTPVHKVTVRSTLRSEIQEMREERENQAEKIATMTARRLALGMEFGSKKSKKAILDRTTNAIKSTASDAAPGTNSAAATSILANMSSKTANMPTKAELDAAVDENKPRPKANLAAESVLDVYPMSEIVGQDLMTAISVKDWVAAAQNGQELTVGSRFVAKRINKLAKGGEEGKGEIKKLKVLKFILLCINFHASLRGKGRGALKLPLREKLAEVMDAPGNIIDGLKRRFASVNNDMTRWHVDNLITHICAAALYVDNFEVDVNDLRDDLKLENKDIKRYFLELGARVNNPTEAERIKMKITKAEVVNHSIAKLKLPLAFPKPTRGGPSKKR